MNQGLKQAVSVVKALYATHLRRGWTLLLAAVAIGAVYMLGCGGGGDGVGPKPGATEYGVDVISDGTGASGSGSYKPGDTVAISAGAAPEGMRFKNWTVSSDSVVLADPGKANTTFIMPMKVVTVTAVFEEKSESGGEVLPKTYGVIVLSAGKGAGGSGDYEAGALVTISAGTAPDSMRFVKWTSGSGVIFANADSAKTSFIMPAKIVTVSAEFEGVSGPVTPTTYAVTVTSAGTGSSGGGTYAVGATVTVSAGTAPDGTRFAKWTAPSGSGVVFADADSAATTFIMPAKAVTVTATFESIDVTPKTYMVAISSEGEGASGGGGYEAGDTVAISAGTPPEGKKFKNWMSSGGVVFANVDSANTKFVMPANDVAVIAKFEVVSGPVVPTTYAVTVSSAGTDFSGGGDYEAGDTVVISAGTAPTGMQFKRWTSPSGSGVIFADTSASTTKFIMPAKAVTVTATFEAQIIKYAVTVDAGTGATGAGNYEAGATVSISAGTPSKGQMFKKWTSASSGVNFADPNSAATTFTMPAHAVVLTAEFEFAFIDTRNGKKYKTTVIDGKVWMAENLNFKTQSGSWFYDDNPDNGEKYGRLYDWETASTVCPTGWHLPSRQEWQDLVDFAGGNDVAGKKLKSTSGWNGDGNGTDDYGFSALPGGSIESDGKSDYVGNFGSWWTATESSTSTKGAYLRYMYNDRDSVGSDSNMKIIGRSVRCVADD